MEANSSIGDRPRGYGVQSCIHIVAEEYEYGKNAPETRWKTMPCSFSMLQKPSPRMHDQKADRRQKHVMESRGNY